MDCGFMCIGSYIDDIFDIFLCSLPFELIKPASDRFLNFSMQNYFPIISRNLTKSIIPYSKSEAGL